MLEVVWNAIVDHWVETLVGFAFMAVGLWYGRQRALRKFRRREFFERLNISLNSIVDGTLKIRTLAELPCQSVFLNSAAVDKLLSAASKTTVDNPLIPFDTDDYWFYLNSVLNEVSEKYSEGFLLRDAGMPTTAVHFVLCLTNECDGNVRTRKIRAMVIEQSLLENLPEEMPVLEQDYHDTRWKTLEIMAKRWKENPIEFKEMEILVPQQSSNNTPS